MQSWWKNLQEHAKNRNKKNKPNRKNWNSMKLYSEMSNEMSNQA